MAYHLDPPLSPRSGVTLNVLGICRISTANQDPRSLQDQEALLRRYVADHYEGPVNFHIIASMGSGEHLDRRELVEAEEKVESRAFDAVIAEDLARVCRRNYAVFFCEHAEDHDTRLIAINDSIDTGRADWRMHAMFSAFKHEASNKDTALRIRRTMRHRFSQRAVSSRPRSTGISSLQGPRATPSFAKTPRPSQSTTRYSAGSRRGPASPRSPTG